MDRSNSTNSPFRLENQRRPVGHPAAMRRRLQASGAKRSTFRVLQRNIYCAAADRPTASK